MAIAFDNAANFNFVSGTTSVAYTCATNAFLMVTSATLPTSMTYAGISMTKYLTFTPSIHDGNQNTVTVWILANAPGGSHTLAVGGTGVSNGTVGIVSYTGVDSVNPEANATGFSNNGVNNTQVLSLGTTVTTVTNNAWSVMLVRGTNSTNTFVIGGGSGTIRTSGVFVSGDGTQGIYDSNGAVTPVGNSTLTSTWNSGTGFISNVVLSLAPYVYVPVKSSVIIM